MENTIIYNWHKQKLFGVIKGVLRTRSVRPPVLGACVPESIVAPGINHSSQSSVVPKFQEMLYITAWKLSSKHTHTTVPDSVGISALFISVFIDILLTLGLWQVLKQKRSQPSWNLFLINVCWQSRIVKHLQNRINIYILQINTYTWYPVVTLELVQSEPLTEWIPLFTVGQALCWVCVCVCELHSDPMQYITSCAFAGEETQTQRV